jgi:hypothetical protein
VGRVVIARLLLLLLLRRFVADKVKEFGASLLQFNVFGIGELGDERPHRLRAVAVLGVR